MKTLTACALWTGLAAGAALVTAPPAVAQDDPSREMRDAAPDQWETQRERAAGAESQSVATYGDPDFGMVPRAPFGQPGLAPSPGPRFLIAMPLAQGDGQTGGTGRTPGAAPELTERMDQAYERFREERLDALNRAWSRFVQEQRAQHGERFAARPGLQEELAGFQEQQRHALDRRYTEFQEEMGEALLEAKQRLERMDAAPPGLRGATSEIEEGEPSQATAGKTQRDLPPVDQTTVADTAGARLLGKPVESRDGQQAGEVADVILGEDSETARELVIRTTGPAGEEELVGVPADQAHLSDTQALVVVDMDRAYLVEREAFRYEGDMNAMVCLR